MSKQALYVGPDWILYAGPGGYDHSEMLAPAILLGGPEDVLTCCLREGEELSSICLLHPAGIWSSVVATRTIVIYLDPLSAAGQAIQHRPCTLKEAPQIHNRLLECNPGFEGVFSARLAPADIRTLVSTVKAVVAVKNESQLEDERLKLVAQELSKNPVGRLDLSSLAAVCGLSSERLRHLFKRQVGMTLSKYKTWQQLHAMFRHLVSTQGPAYDWKPHEAFLSAGFYDDSHGYRTIFQYFGTQRSDGDEELLLVNCLGTVEGCEEV
ncbi:MAG: hypothetical protein CTR55_17475 [Pseudomonas sp.]|uniref:helix-turn-helix domain-containing protein n=1 Tax=Pseudomonas sp. TaxID=306 RepID=UPI000CAE7EC1|nr:AraC family transcriptional regulator [Pseudomonas sp.]PJI47829.1 MAG: hypothetical protein CTR55_17475 [Pseudomonas sp.]